MTPAFAIMGGKAKLREQLVPFFPHSGNRYIELFAGRGNVYFHACQELNYGRWELYDKDVKFLEALKIADLSELPAYVSKEDFKFWRDDDSTISRVLAPAISFSGKGYEHGAQIDRYIMGKYKQRCYTAKRLLEHCKIQEAQWSAFNWGSLRENDFLYLDPPYYNTVAQYTNIDHYGLCLRLNSLKCRWALSGYNNLLYDRNLVFKQKIEIERNLEMAGSLNGAREVVTESLWLNYK